MVDSGNNSSFLYSPYLTDGKSRPWPVSGKPDIFLFLQNENNLGFFTNKTDSFDTLPMRFINQIEDCNYPINIPISGLFCKVNGVVLDFKGVFLNRGKGLTYSFTRPPDILYGSGGSRLYSYVLASLSFGPFCNKTINFNLYGTTLLTCGNSIPEVSGGITCNSAGINFNIDRLSYTEHLKDEINQTTVSGYHAECDPFYFSMVSNTGMYPNVLNPHLYAIGRTNPFATGCDSLWGCLSLYTPPECDTQPYINGLYPQKYDSLLGMYKPDFTLVNGGIVYYDYINEIDVEVYQ